MKRKICCCRRDREGSDQGASKCECCHEERLDVVAYGIKEQVYRYREGQSVTASNAPPPW